MFKPIKKIKSNLAVIISLINASFGILAIYYTYSAKAQSNNSFNYMLAVIFILGAFLMDGLDGFCARRFHSSSDFGKEIDSLCDLVSFGIAPGFLLASFQPYLGDIILFVLFVSSGIIRLAKFNVTKFDGYFRGTPITLNGVLIPLAFWFWRDSVPFVIAILTVTMNLPFKFRKIAFKRIKPNIVR